VIVLVATYVGTPGSGDAIQGFLEEMAPLVKQHEPGCALYQANRSMDNPDNFLLVEHYVDEDALAAHRETPHFKAIIEGKVVPLLERRERSLWSLAVS
jgi:quinol monooxygenase YgiN